MHPIARARVDSPAMLPADLIHVSDDDPGISRKRAGRGWAYYMPDGTHIADTGQRKRLNALAVPPAYDRVWYAVPPNGHLQATGYDERRRKQYRYHPDFREAMEARKFSALSEFGAALPELRKQVASDMRKRSLDRDRVLAAVVRLLDQGLLRVGNERYSKTNRSFGASTLLGKHAEANSRAVMLDYKAKSGKQRQIRLEDASLARFVRKLSDLPGQRLFQYENDDGGYRAVGSSDVNAYIKRHMGDDFSAKHFRTFGASAMAYDLLAAATEPPTIKSITEPVAERLGNTPTMARKSYIHPALIDLCGEDVPELDLPRKTQWLSRAERGLVAFLD